MEKRDKSPVADIAELVQDAAAIRAAARLDKGKESDPVSDEEAELVSDLESGGDDTPPLRQMMAVALAGAPARPRRHAHLFALDGLDRLPAAGHSAPGLEEPCDVAGEPFAGLDAALARMEERRAHLARLFAYRGPFLASKDVARARAMASGEFIDEDWERLWDEMRDREEKSLSDHAQPWADSGAEDGPPHPIDDFAAKEERAMDPKVDGERAPNIDPDPVGRFEAAWADLKRWIAGAKR